MTLSTGPGSRAAYPPSGKPMNDTIQRAAMRSRVAVWSSVDGMVARLVMAAPR